MKKINKIYINHTILYLYLCIRGSHMWLQNCFIIMLYIKYNISTIYSKSHFIEIISSYLIITYLM